MPPNADPLLPVADVYAYTISDKPCGPLLATLVAPYGATLDHAEKHKIESAKTSTYSIASFTSFDSIFLPRYSGVRPTINPAMNTVSTTITSIPYMPAPTPPKMISPSMMFSSGIIPPSGVYESCHELIAPHDASVVIVANNAEFATPKRTSFTSMFTTACSAPLVSTAACFTPYWSKFGLPRASK